MSKSAVFTAVEIDWLNKFQENQLKNPVNHYHTLILRSLSPWPNDFLSMSALGGSVTHGRSFIVNTPFYPAAGGLENRFNGLGTQAQDWDPGLEWGGDSDLKLGSGLGTWYLAPTIYLPMGACFF